MYLLAADTHSSTSNNYYSVILQQIYVVNLADVLYEVFCAYKYAMIGE